MRKGESERERERERERREREERERGEREERERERGRKREGGGGLTCIMTVTMYTLNSEPKALTGDKSSDKSLGCASAFIRGFSPVKAEGEEFNVLILSYTRELSRPFKENKG